MTGDPRFVPAVIYPSTVEWGEMDQKILCFFWHIPFSLGILQILMDCYITPFVQSQQRIYVSYQGSSKINGWVSWIKTPYLS